jgi:hypothetical protein
MDLLDEVHIESASPLCIVFDDLSGTRATSRGARLSAQTLESCHTPAAYLLNDYIGSGSCNGWSGMPDHAINVALLRTEATVDLVIGSAGKRIFYKPSSLTVRDLCGELFISLPKLRGTEMTACQFSTPRPSDIIVGLLLDQPFEVGESHPAENMLKDTILSLGTQALGWLKNVMRENAGSPAIVSSLLRFFGRLDRNIFGDWGPELIRGAIRDDDIEIREAAVRAVEEWNDPAFRDDLRDALS